MQAVYLYASRIGDSITMDYPILSIKRWMKTVLKVPMIMMNFCV